MSYYRALGDTETEWEREDREKAEAEYAARREAERQAWAEAAREFRWRNRWAA